MTLPSSANVEPEIVPRVLEAETGDDGGLTSDLANVDVGVKGEDRGDGSETVTERTGHHERESISVPREVEIRTEVVAAAAEVHVQVRPLLSRLIYGMIDFDLQPSRTTSAYIIAFSYSPTHSSRSISGFAISAIATRASTSSSLFVKPQSHAFTSPISCRVSCSLTFSLRIQISCAVHSSFRRPRCPSRSFRTQCGSERAPSCRESAVDTAVFVAYSGTGGGR